MCVEVDRLRKCTWCVFCVRLVMSGFKERDSARRRIQLAAIKWKLDPSRNQVLERSEVDSKTLRSLAREDPLRWQEGEGGSSSTTCGKGMWDQGAGKTACAREKPLCSLLLSSRTRTVGVGMRGHLVENLFARLGAGNYVYWKRRGEA